MLAIVSIDENEMRAGTKMAPVSTSKHLSDPVAQHQLMRQLLTCQALCGYLNLYTAASWSLLVKPCVTERLSDAAKGEPQKSLPSAPLSQGG